MAKLCSSKAQKSRLKKKLDEDESLFAKCKFKLNTSLNFNSDDFHVRRKPNDKNLGSNNLNINQNATPTGKLKFQCHYEERNRRAELRRKRIIQNLKNNYKINIEGFSEDVAREIIRKTEMIEKEKKQKEKRAIERSMVMITRLLEEQKYKNRAKKPCRLPWKKTIKRIRREPCIEEKFEKYEEYGEIESACISKLGEKSEASYKEEEKTSAEIKEAEKSIQEEKTKIFPICKEIMKGEDSEESIVRKKRPLCVPTELSLESTPKHVIFQDYKKGKVYLQDLKITNIGTETIHCRYLGIVVQTKTEDRFPIGVAVRDNVKLSPGLSCSTKIRLCSKDDTNRLQCSIVYETRRLDKPSQYSWFFVQVICVPVQALVNVIPTKITFPSVTWCESKDPKYSRLMKKVLKIKNYGGKGCSCKISKEIPETNLNEEIIDEEIEEEYERVSSLTKSVKSDVFKNEDRHFSKIEEFQGEDDLLFRDEAIQTSIMLIEELIDNVFANFRFYPKYYIELPPHTTTHVEVKFIPQYKGFHHEMFIIQFEDCDNCQEERIEVTGNIKKLPIRTEPEIIDFKTCISNSGVYAGTFKVFNESKGVFSILLRVPAAVKKHAHVHPKAATLQPCSNSTFSVRLYPRITLARDAPQYYKRDSKILEFPVFIYDANSRSCKKDRIKIYVFALITNYCLQLFPPSVNFGTVTTLETVRAELELTNHSMAIQEYGFLNLPKGVRVEPNMGFGRILPKEKIKLYLLYSPGEDLITSENSKELHEFQIEVTTIAEYGGFREKLEPEEESVELWGEDKDYEFPPLEEELPFLEEAAAAEEESDGIDICEEYSSDEDKKIIKIEEQEKKIREFLKENRDKKSELSFFKRMDVQARDVERSRTTVREDFKNTLNDIYDFEEEEEELERIISSKGNLNRIKCQAFILQPRCRLSASVIQLPATPCSSFSLYRFRLHALNVSPRKNCACGFEKAPKKDSEKMSFRGSFEFQYFCPHIKLEPESGFIQAGDSISINIIFRPEFPAEELRKKSRAKKAEKVAQERKVEKETPRTGSKQSKSKRNTSVAKSIDLNPENAIEEIINASLYELENYDLFAGERSLQELISPFYVETKLLCIVKTFQPGDEMEQTEIHEMVLICPAIKPSFIYLGTSQEIKFNKVLIGTRSRMLLKVQNISFERISPLATLLNPVGSFHCPAGVKKVEVDPEHIWQQPLVYAPLKCKGIEKEYFEIYYKSTNIFLTVSGEGIEPEFKITPNFACCLIGAKLGGIEEIKLDIENLTKLKLNLNIEIEFSKIGPDIEKLEKVEDDNKSKKTDKEGATESRRSKNIERNVQFWEEIPESFSLAMNNLQDMTEWDLRAFYLGGVGNNNEVLVPPLGKQQFKIQFSPPLGKNDVRYANKYVIMLERVSPLKELLVMGKIIGAK